MEKIVNLNGNTIKINIINEYSTSNIFEKNIILYTDNINSIPKMAYLTNIGITPIDNNDYLIQSCIDKIKEIKQQNDEVIECLATEPVMKILSTQRKELMNDICDINDKIDSIEYKKNKAYEIAREEKGNLTDSLKNDIDNAFEQVKQKLQKKKKAKQDEIKENEDLQENIIGDMPKYLEQISRFKKEIKKLLDIVHDCKAISNINLDKREKKQIGKYETIKKEVTILELEIHIYEVIKDEIELSRKDLKEYISLQEKLNVSKEKLQQIENEYVNIGDYTVVSSDDILNAYQIVTMADRTIPYMKSKIEEQQQKKEQEEKKQRLENYKKRQMEQEVERQKKYRQIQKERIEHNENAKYDSELLDTSMEAIIREERKKTNKETLELLKEATISLFTEDSPFLSTIYNKIKESKFANSSLVQKINTHVKNQMQKRKIKFKRHMERRQKIKKVLDEFEKDIHRKYR